MSKLEYLLALSRTYEQRLHAAEKNQLIDAIMQYQFKYVHRHYPSVAEQVGRIMERVLPEAIIQQIRSFAAEGSYHTLVIRNCPAAHSRTTSMPLMRREQSEKTDAVSSCFLLGLSWLLAAVPYPHESTSVFQEVNRSHIREGEVPLALSTQEVHERMAPDFVVELCVGGRQVTETLSVDEMILHLPPWVIENMLKPQFMMHAGPDSQIQISRLGPLLTFNDTGSYMLHYNANPHRTTGISTRAQETLDYIQQWLSGNPWVEKRVLQAGDLLIYKNKRVLVGRSACDAHDRLSQRRLIQRMYLSKGLGTELR